MLKHLKIQNFALISSLVLDIAKGFTVLTGETGSGKSILLGALDLVLGERADYSAIGPNGDKAIVEAEFNLANYNIQKLFEENDIDYYDLTIFRREITRQGRSRAFINDSPVQLNVLKLFSEKLIHIHSQHNSLELRNADFQMDVIDVLGGIQGDKVKFLSLYKKWGAAKKELEMLKLKANQFEQEKDYNQFLLDELEELNLGTNNFSKLEEELVKNENVDELKSTLSNVVSAIDDENGAQPILSKLKVILGKVKGLDKLTDQLGERVFSVIIELNDISNEAENYIDSIEVNPERLSELVQLLDLYNRLLRKHNVIEQSQLVEIKETLDEKLKSTNSLTDEIISKEEGVNIFYKELVKLANNLHEKRRSVIPLIENKVISLLDELKMPQTQFKIDLNLKADLSPQGFSEIKFLFSSNKGMDLNTIDKGASGGELSRIMLVIQKIISEKKQLPTIIFDEIDTGVSGEVAQKIGGMLGKMGEDAQLLAITHLPQVASKAKNHIKVFKETKGNQTNSRVVVLNQTERIEEVARLMSGEKITDAAILNARNLMEM